MQLKVVHRECQQVRTGWNWHQRIHDHSIVNYYVSDSKISTQYEMRSSRALVRNGNCVRSEIKYYKLEDGDWAISESEFTYKDRPRLLYHY